MRHITNFVARKLHIIAVNGKKINGRSQLGASVIYTPQNGPHLHPPPPNIGHPCTICPAGHGRQVQLLRFFYKPFYYTIFRYLFYLQFLSKVFQIDSLMLMLNTNEVRRDNVGWMMQKSRWFVVFLLNNLLSQNFSFSFCLFPKIWIENWFIKFLIV